VTEGRPAKHEISMSTRRIIEKHNEFDIELHEFAKRLFVEKMREELSYREVAIFRVVNRIYGTTYTFMEKSITGKYLAHLLSNSVFLKRPL
jgi:hypothetical protein